MDCYLLLAVSHRRGAHRECSRGGSSDSALSKASQGAGAWAETQGATAGCRRRARRRSRASHSSRSKRTARDRGSESCCPGAGRSCGRASGATRAVPRARAYSAASGGTAFARCGPAARPRPVNRRRSHDTEVRTRADTADSVTKHITFLPCRCLPPIGSNSFGFSGPEFCEDAAVLPPGLPVRLFIPMTFRQFTDPHRHSVISCPSKCDTIMAHKMSSSFLASSKGG